MPKLKIDEKKLLERIIEEGTEAHRRRAEYDKFQLEWSKRFKALRSVQALDSDIKLRPWRGAANVGIPLDATVIFALLARYLKATFGLDDVVNVRGRGQSDVQWAPIMQDYANWEILEEMKAFMSFYHIYQALLIQGDVIGKTIWDRRVVEYEEDTFFMVDEFGNPMPDKDGNPMEVEEKHPEIIDQTTGGVFRSQPAEVTKRNVLYDGPKIFVRPNNQILVPTDADNPDPTEIDWITDISWQPFSWFVKRAQKEIFNKDAVTKLKAQKDEKRAKPQEQQPDVRGIRPKEWTNRFPVWEWHGTHEDEDGRERELIAIVEPTEKIMLGVIPNNFFNKTGRRQFVHWQFSPNNNAFYARGVPEWLRGMRSMVDAMVNQGIDRGSLYNNPPVTYNKLTSGFNPAAHKFGPGRSWGLRDRNQVGVMQLPPERQAQFIYQEFLIGLIQRLFGVSDFQLGSSIPQGMATARAGTKTATGISIMVSEANTMFDMRIRIAQEWSNPDFVKQIMAHNALNVTSEKVFGVTEGPDPFKRITPQALKGNYDYIFRGNSITTNKLVEREDITTLYNLFVSTQNPFVVQDDDLMQNLTQQIFNAYDRKTIKVKSLSDLRLQGIKNKLEQRQLAQQVATAEKMGLSSRLMNVLGGGNGGRARTETT